MLFLSDMPASSVEPISIRIRVEDHASGPLRSLTEQFAQLCADAVAWARAQDIDNEVAWTLWDYGIRGLCGAPRERPDEIDALYADVGGEA